MNKAYFLGFLVILTILFTAISAGSVFACTYHTYQQCTGNNLYWYDSCGNQQDLAQYCQNGCYNNSCQYNNNYNNYNYNNNNYGNCTYHAYRLCSGNNIYWYDSCGTQQDLYLSCYNGQVCQYGQCVVNIQQPIVQPDNNYVAHYNIKCAADSLYWYDSLGVASGFYKNCADNNSCTLDGCSAGKCANILKCDGSSCANGSSDYNTYCATQPSQPVPAQPSANPVVNGLSVSFFAKQDPNSSQWQKTTQVGSNGKIYFMISVANNSTAQIDNVSISTNIPTEISSLGNLQINGVVLSGDIVSGINIGSLSPTNTKSITFEGKTQNLSAVATKQAIVTSNVSAVTQSDSISITLDPTQAVVAAAVSSAPTTSGFWGFLKHWYLWIFAALVLISLFIIVFRRLSSNV